MEHTGEDDWVEDIKVLIGITFKVQKLHLVPKKLFRNYPMLNVS